MLEKYSPNWHLLRRNARRALSQCNLNSRTDICMLCMYVSPAQSGLALEPTSSCHASLQMKRSVMCQCENTCTAAARKTQKQSGNNRAQNNQWVHDAVPLRHSHSHSHCQCHCHPHPHPHSPYPNPIPISILIPLGALTVIVINLASSAQSNSLGTLQTGLSLGFCSASHCSAAAALLLASAWECKKLGS